MLEIKGLFKCTEIKEISGKKVLTLVNSEKDKDGKFTNTYYQVWVNDKVSNMVNAELKKEITKILINIEGYLKVSKNGNYTNLTIYPNKIEKYKKQN
ncbi:MAG: hypothetical protein WC346_17840 [Methanogenium sp.]|jgi:hypothetical protein